MDNGLGSFDPFLFVQSSVTEVFYCSLSMVAISIIHVGSDTSLGPNHSG